MAKIVYGVSGEGAGHSSRAREMIKHLEQLGHTIKVVSYDRGYNNLKLDFDVFETKGLCNDQDSIFHFSTYATT